MYELEADVAALEEISEARAAWYEETREARDRAAAARRELQARSPRASPRTTGLITSPSRSKAPEAERKDHEPEVKPGRPSSRITRSSQLETPSSQRQRAGAADGQERPKPESPSSAPRSRA